MSVDQSAARAGAPAFRILVIVSRPLDVDDLPELADSWAISYGLTEVGAPVHVLMLTPPTLEEFGNALARPWDIIHFDGHAEDAQSGAFLVFEDETGLAVHVTGDRLARLLSQQPPRLLILSACGSAAGDDFGLAGELNRAGVPVCIGTVERVTAAWTRRFMRPLYAMVGAGRSIKEAFEQAVRTVDGGIAAGEFKSPELVGRQVDATFVAPGLRGKPTLDEPRLVNWARAWQGEFQGHYVDRDDSLQPVYPPTGRKGFAVTLARLLMDGERLVVITGMGGIGKSAMAAFTARRVAWKYPGGVFWLDGRDYLESQIPLEALLDLFWEVFGQEFLRLPTPQKVQKVRAYMGRPERTCLLVVDNAEGMDPALRRFIAHLPEPSAALLATRDAPEYGGAIVALPPMMEGESLSLLRAEIERRGSESSEAEEAASDGETVALIEIIGLLDNHPLALLHAAALVASEGLARTLRLVREHPAQGVDTHERFDFSYLTLTGGQRALLHRLGSFSSAFDEQAVEAVCTDGRLTGEPLPDWESDLRVLRNRSFVEQHNREDIQPGYRRFRLHPVMRDYVRTKVIKTAPAAAAASGEHLLEDQDLRTAQFYRGMMHYLAGHLNDLKTAGAAVVTAHVEKHNLLDAQRLFTALGHVGEVLEFCHLLDQLFRRSGDWAERRQAIEAGLKMAEELGNHVEVGARLHNLAIVAMDMGDLAEAEELCSRSIRVSEQIEGQPGRRAVAKSVQLLGTLLFNAGKHEDARSAWQQSLRLSEEVGDKEVIGLSHLGLSMIDTVNKKSQEARASLQIALAAFRELDKKDQITGALHHLGILAYDTGDYASARASLEECLEINEALTDLDSTAKTLAQLAMVDRQEGLFEAALDRTEDAEKIFLILGNERNINHVKEQWRRIKAEADAAADSA